MSKNPNKTQESKTQTEKEDTPLCFEQFVVLFGFCEVCVLRSFAQNYFRFSYFAGLIIL